MNKSNCPIIEEKNLVLEGRSAEGVRWGVHESDSVYIDEVCRKFGISTVLAKIIHARHIEYDNIENFLYPKIKNELPDPYHLKDMDKAVKRIVKAVQSKEKITVFSDYDVDGATSSSMIHMYFSSIGVEIETYIPDRINEGYGPNINALMKIKENGSSLCITADCGTVAFEPLESAMDAGLDIIVIDHHMSEKELPKVLAVVNPNRLDEENSTCKDLAAVGVSFLVLVAVNSALRESKFFDETNIPIPNLMNYLDLVALGTVCDVMKLTGLNRVFVHKGLKKINESSNLGITTLLNSLKIISDIESYHLGFIIGPRINAGGRIGDAALGSRLLRTTDYNIAREIVQTLEDLNDRRKDMEKDALEDAMMQVENELEKKLISSGENPSFIMVHGTWHMGIIGIVASRLKDKHKVPAIVITIENGVGRASARSVKGIDLGKAVIDAQIEGLIIEGGGHAMAAGFSVKEEKIDELSKFFSKRLLMSDNMEVDAVVLADAILPLQQMNWELWMDIQRAAPFGAANPDPKFIAIDVIVSDIFVSNKVVSDNIRCTLTDINKTCYIRAIAFRSVGTIIEDVLQSSKNDGIIISVLGKLKSHNRYRKAGKKMNNSDMRMQFIIEDVKLPSDIGQ